MLTKNYLATYAKSFNWAGFFLPKKTYKKCSALYDFCREVDNIADDENKIEVKKDNFIKFRNNFFNKNFDDPVIKNMWDLINEFSISTKIVDDLFEGINSDIKENVKLNSKKELLIYSYRVAGTVGLMMAKILNVHKEQSLKSAIDLGIAMQLTNISRDVMEDKKSNRFYINESFEDIKTTIKLSEKFYENSFYSIKEIPLSFRFSILVARRVYRKIGHKILNKKNIENYKKSGKIYVSNIEKISQTILASFDLITLLFVRSNKHMRKNEHDIINQQINLNERI